MLERVALVPAVAVPKSAAVFTEWVSVWEVVLVPLVWVFVVA